MDGSDTVGMSDPEFSCTGSDSVVSPPLAATGDTNASWLRLVSEANRLDIFAMLGLYARALFMILMLYPYRLLRTLMAREPGQRACNFRQLQPVERTSRCVPTTSSVGSANVGGYELDPGWFYTLQR